MDKKVELQVINITNSQAQGRRICNAIGRSGR